MLRRLARATGVRLTNTWPAKQCLGRLSAPVATIAFDDFPHSAWTTGARVLDGYGARATFFVSAAFSPQNLRRCPAAGATEGVRYFEPEDVVAAHAQGHEIGCHSFEHRHAVLLTNAQLEESIEKNAAFLRELLGDVVMTSFSYPQGRANIRTKRFLSRHFAACRGGWPGINAGLVDLSLLRCFNLDSQTLERYPVSRLIDRAKARNGWLIFAAHDVSASPSRWGCTPKLLDSVVSQLVQSGFEILPLKHALARVAFR
jgi:peptidoglycan/xylan/chitin deacetylase (PgdA/CDA1 family)